MTTDENSPFRSLVLSIPGQVDPLCFRLEATRGEAVLVWHYRKSQLTGLGREEPLISEFLTTALENLLPTVGGEPKI